MIREERYQRVNQGVKKVDGLEYIKPFIKLLL